MRTTTPSRAAALLAMTLQFSVPAAGQQQPLWEWTVQLGGPGWDMPNGLAPGDKGRVFVAGGFTDTLMVGDKTVKGQGNRDVYAASFDEKGKPAWLWNGGGPGMDKVTAVAAAPDGGLYVAGTVSGDAQVGKTKIGGKEPHLFLALLDGKGKCRWTSTIGLTGTASGYLLAATPDGDILWAGSFTDTLAIGPETLIGNGQGDAFVARYSPEGKARQAVAVGGPGRDQPTALAPDPRGGFYMGLSYSKPFARDSVRLDALSDSPRGNAALVRFNDQMLVVGKKTFRSSGYADISGLAVDTGDQVWLAGNFGPDLAVDTLAACSNGLNDFFLAKAWGTDSIEWLRPYGSRYQDRATVLAPNLLGGAMVAGSFSDTMSVGAFRVAAAGPSPNTFVAQFDAKGVPTWVNAVGGDGASIGTRVAADASGNLYLAGTFRGGLEAPFGPLASRGGEDVFLAKHHNCPPYRRAISAPDLLCEGATTELSVGPDFYNVVWNGQEQGRRLSIGTPGTYTVTMADAKGCAAADTVVVGAAPAIRFSLGADTAVAIGPPLRLEGPAGFAGYRWQDGTAAPGYTTQSPDGLPGTVAYTLEVIDSLGCTGADTLRVEYYTRPGFADFSGGGRLITLYPSPVEDILYWHLDTPNDVQLTAEVADAAGNRLYLGSVRRYVPGEVRQIPVGGLRPGHYYLTLASGGQKLSAGFVKK